MKNHWKSIKNQIKYTIITKHMSKILYNPSLLSPYGGLIIMIIMIYIYVYRTLCPYVWLEGFSSKYIEKYIEICSIYVKISWEIKKTKARPSAAPPRGRPRRCCFLYFPWYFYMNGTYFYIFFSIFSYYIS